MASDDIHGRIRRDNNLWIILHTTIWYVWRERERERERSLTLYLRHVISRHGSVWHRSIRRWLWRTLYFQNTAAITILDFTALRTILPLPDESIRWSSQKVSISPEAHVLMHSIPCEFHVLHDGTWLNLFAPASVRIASERSSKTALCNYIWIIMIYV